MPAVVAIRLPTASRPRLNFFANASLTIATFGARRRVGSRELAAGEQRDAERPEVAGADVVVVASAVSVSGPAVNPSTDTPLPQLLPASSGTVDADTPVTPGSAAELVLDPLEQLARLLRRRSRSARGETPKHDHVVRFQSEIDAADVEQAAR